MSSISVLESFRGRVGVLRYSVVPVCLGLRPNMQEALVGHQSIGSKAVFTAL